MQTRNRLLDDLAKVATSALGVAGGVKDEVEGRLRQQFERILADMDLVTREEFEVVQDMAAQAREEQEQLLERLAAMEKEVAALKKSGSAKPTRARSASAKAPGAKTSSAKSTGTKSTGAKSTGSKRSTAAKKS